MRNGIYFRKKGGDEMARKLAAELFGTFWLVLGGCGTAVLAGHAVGWVGVSAAFGLTVLTMAYAVGHISGGHFNPAVTLGLVVAGKCDKKDMLSYWIAQIIGGLLAATVIWVIHSGSPGYAGVGGFASNGYGVGAGAGYSPMGYGMVAALVCEIVMTAMFLLIILGATSKNAPAGFAPIAIGLGLTLIHLISIPVTNTSVNPARSISQAVFAGGAAMSHLWLFIVAPLAGAALGAAAWKFLLGKDGEA